MKIRLATLAAFALFASGSQAALTNGGFEGNAGLSSPGFTILTTAPQLATFGGWSVAPNNAAGIEVWRQPFNNVSAYEGNQFVELNSNTSTTIFQDVSTVAGQSVGYTFAHRARVVSPQTTQTITFTATDLGADGIFNTADDSVLVTRTVTDGTSAWGFYADRGFITSGHMTRLSFTVVSPLNNSVGNFLDAVRFDSGVPEPTALALVGLGLAGIGLSRRRKA